MLAVAETVLSPVAVDSRMRSLQDSTLLPSPVAQVSSDKVPGPVSMAVIEAPPVATTPPLIVTVTVSWCRLPI